jgi:hypothetical protein
MRRDGLLDELGCPLLHARMFAPRNSPPARAREP